ncbi:DUF3054 domain-containing protein [Desertihabitans aurantiacus]|uniref:DUF3054 domain-containing protein n=1 Tax=Desertihabitans aurantiacus TaxID=2282477 RepID=UPI0018E522BF|nr:DUF3054 domain-containing protein [Desertihabitans aurantiacus]
MRPVLVMLTDVAAVLLFVLVGRANHAEGLSPLGVLQTAAPFLLALVAAWALTRPWQVPPRLPATALRAALLVWAVTALGGLLLRGLLEGAVPPLSFALVTVLTLGVLLVGWRLVAGALGARRLRRT